ncbi:MAG: hypothetical protein ACQERD_00665 [Campylobacterota bacterium]
MATKNKKESSISDIIFKILVGITILVFIAILVTRSSDSYSFNENKLRTTGDNNFGAPKEGDSKPAKDVPSELKWFDVFKGISND